jgi:hypothetical protein
MADQVIILPVDSSGKKVDTTELTVGANTVERQRINVADPVNPAGLGGVINTTPASTDYGLEVREVSVNSEGATPVIPVGPTVFGRVNDTPESYVAGELHPLSITSEGRLRVSNFPAYTDLDFFGSDNPNMTTAPNQTDFSGIFG